MPELPAAAKVLKLDFVHSYGGDLDALSRFFMRYSGTAPTAAELNTLASNAGAAWSANMASLANGDDVALETVAITDLSSTTSAQGEAAIGAAGTRAGAGLTANDAMVIGYEINRRFRGGHARGYWPFGSDPDLDGPQDWETGFLTEVDDGFEGFITAVGTTPWAGSGTLTQVSVSYYAGFTVITNPLTGRARNVPTLRVAPVIDDVQSIIARLRVGSQRRRLGKS
jgi:hypothetical protein